MGPNSEVTLTIWRNKAEQQVKVRLGEWTTSAGGQQSSGGGGSGEAGGRLGITVKTLTPALALQFRLRSGEGVVVTDVDPSGPAAEAGIRPGDLIQEVNRQAVRTPADVAGALQKNARAPILLVIRGGQAVYIPVPLQ
jgi:S1-C subfamily serine protease